TGVAVIGGKLLAKRISERHICLAGGVLFLAFAITSIVMGVEDESASINGGFSVDGPVHVRNEEFVACTGVVDYDYDATECWGRNDVCDRGRGDGEGEVEEVDFFQKEKGKSLTLIDEIVALAVEQRDLQGTGKAFESVLGRCQRLCYDLKDLLQPYQERGALLDAHMADLTSPLIAFIVDQVSRKEPHAWPKSCHLICSTLYLIFKVRGLSKAPFGHFPHEISLIEPVLDQAEVLLLTESDNKGSEALEGWESNCTTALQSHCERLHRAAALCLARLVAREDILENNVKNDFFSQLNALSDITSVLEDSNGWQSPCILVAHQLSKLPTLRNMPNSELIAIVQAGSRAWGLRGAPKKVVVALCGRICAELVDRECPDHVRQARQQWRYRQAGGRRLCSPLPQEALSDAKKVKVDDELTVGEFSMRQSVQNLVENVIGEILLPSLEDPVTVVRWAAAKALGRVSNVLPSAAAVDVLAALTPDGDDGLRSLGSAHRLHGTSLAVAEMLRRLGSTALAFDSPESLGSLLDKVARPAFECQGLAAARDAACFVLWAVARGVCDQEIVGRNLDMILRLLVCSSLLDPNIVVRRAASAAAQEVVGRLGCTTADDAGFLFVNLVDYWTVANRSYAATTLLGDVTGKLCVGDPHLVPFVLDHLCRLHLRSPDKKTRELAARSIGAVVPFVDEGRLSEYISHTLLPACLEEAASHPTTFRHGALLAVSEVVVACENLVRRDGSRSGKILDTSTTTLIRNVVPKLEKARLYRGRGGEMIRAAACSLVQAVFYARSCIPLKPNTIPRYIQSINSSIRHFTAAVQIAAAEALMALVVCRPGEATIDEITRAEADYVKKLKVTDENVAARRGYVLALALLARAREAPPQPEVVSLFIREATAWPEHPISKDVVDAETRRWAVVGLLAVAEKGGSEVAAKVVRALVRCMVIDYATDTRGDVGRWIRQDAATGVSALVALASSGGLSSSWREALLADETLAGLIAASVSRLDHVRVVALRGIEDIAMGRRRQEGGAFALVYESIRKGYEA
ncbi:hypothetical protein FOL46_009359, partial [Perkinsus olseni]